jgi:hypothetical protein
MVHRAHVRPAHRENRPHRLIPAGREMIVKTMQVLRDRGAPGHLIRYGLDSPVG